MLCYRLVATLKKVAPDRKAHATKAAAPKSIHLAAVLSGGAERARVRWRQQTHTFACSRSLFAPKSDFTCPSVWH